MAVYTHIQEEDLRACLARFSVGELLSFEGIPEGVENTNYLLNTTAGKFVLTLFEKRVSLDELPFYVSFMEHLKKQGIPCPAIAMDRSGRYILSLGGKHGIISSFLDGRWPRVVLPADCGEAGMVLAKMHVGSKGFKLKRRNAMALPAWKSLIHASQSDAEKLESGLFSFLDQELDYLDRNWPKYLPRGVVHADFFPDNVLFDRGILTGVIDFFFSCTEAFAYDLMLAFNPWCFDAQGNLDLKKSAEFLNRYQKIRPLTRGEAKALPFFGRAAATRIIATRLYDWFNPAEGALVRTKDPMEHVRILRFHQQISSAEAYGLPA